MQRSRALDGIRGLAALSVLAFHVWLYRTDRPMELEGRGLLDHVLFEANLGLICFFVLSGFLLYRAFARAALRGGPGVGTGDYALRRVARIVPAYWVCLAGCLVLFALSGYDAITPSAAQLGLFVLFLQNYSPETIMGLNPVTWTLGVEAAFYVVLPVLGAAALALGPRRPRAQAALLGALVVLTLGWNWLVLRQGWDAVAAKALPAYLGHFALGMLAALWLERRAVTRRPALTPRATAALALTGAAVVVALAAWHETRSTMFGAREVVENLPAAAGFALLITATAAGSGGTLRALGTRPLAWVGMVSYGVYLWHLPLLLAVREVGWLPEPLWSRMAVVLGLSLLAGWLSWTLVERPAIEWAHRRAPARRPRPAHARAGSGAGRALPEGAQP